MSQMIDNCTNACICDACGKQYSNKYNLKKHWTRQPLCEQWINMKPGLKDYVDDKFDVCETESNSRTEDSALKLDLDGTQCRVCNEQFANVGNLNRHLHSNLICQKWSLYNEMKPISLYATFEAPKNKICHIIWNVFLVDKETIMNDNFPQLVVDENITYVIGIVKETLLPSIELVQTKVPNVQFNSLLYKGHSLAIDWEQYDSICNIIEENRAKRENVLVFCNSGYQRSLPLIVYYLIKTHPDEIPCIEKAIDMILSQVDKENFVNVKEDYVRLVEDLIGDKLRKEI